MSFRRWGLSIVIAASLVLTSQLVASQAAAQQAATATDAAPAGAAVAAPPSDDARGLFLRGQTAYSQGDYEDAATLWERAYALEARVGLQYNLSQAYERLGRLSDAAAALDAYVDGTTPDDPRLADARARLSAIRERINRTAMILEGGPEGALLLVDGEDRGRLPRRDPLLVSPGNHEIRVRAPGFQDFAASVAVPAGQSVDVGIEMIPVQSGGVSLGPILLLAGGGAVLVAGLGVGGAALGQAGSAPSSTSAQANDARTLALVSDILWPTGAAILAGGLVWLIVDLTSTSDSGESASAALHVTPLLGPSLVGFSADGHF
ncbi:MAG: tetratricopeptide repeat protein [Deltaproteobacteria bacterium]|nr:tetratricopeptide repeat protein [Deltaproteobacteria bacterium]